MSAFKSEPQLGSWANGWLVYARVPLDLDEPALMTLEPVSPESLFRRYLRCGWRTSIRRARGSNLDKVVTVRSSALQEGRDPGAKIRQSRPLTILLCLPAHGRAHLSATH